MEEANSQLRDEGRRLSEEVAKMAAVRRELSGRLRESEHRLQLCVGENERLAQDRATMEEKNALLVESGRQMRDELQEQRLLVATVMSKLDEKDRLLQESLVKENSILKERDELQERCKKLILERDNKTDLLGKKEQKLQECTGENSRQAQELRRMEEENKKLRLAVLEASEREERLRHQVEQLDARMSELKSDDDGGVVRPTLRRHGGSFVPIAMPEASAISDPLLEFLTRHRMQSLYPQLHKAGIKYEKLVMLERKDLERIAPDLGGFLGEKLLRVIQEEFGAKGGVVVGVEGGVDCLLRASSVQVSDEYLGRGSFGEVYRGELRAGLLTFPVAVKEIALSQVPAKKIVSEVQRMAKLQHPSVLRAYGCYFEGKTAKLVFEYCEKRSLDHYLKKERPGIQRRVELLLSAVQGFAYLHSQDVIHRDIKPENVLISSDNSPKICDFGEAKRIASITGKTGVVGTPRFIPDPSIPRTPKEVDVYAFGILAYEVLSGKQAFEDLLRSKPDLGDLALLAYIHQSGEHPEVNDIGGAVSDELKCSLSACWAKEPGLRPSFADLEVVFAKEGKKNELSG